jgi:ATP-dependent 26S proteasome regulatory subunit
VLFFDEADSLLSKRVSTGESCSTSINQNRNCLMQELDRFDGVVIVTTNLFENYDPALLRRIQRHIKFRNPDASMRRELFALHLPNPDRVRADYAVLAELSKGLSGGDILNVCVNAIHAGSVDADPAKWKVTQGMLEREIRKVRRAKREHEGRRGRAGGGLGSAELIGGEIAFEGGRVELALDVEQGRGVRGAGGVLRFPSRGTPARTPT